MTHDELVRRDILQSLAALPLAALLTQASEATAQTPPIKVDTKGLVAKINSRLCSQDFSRISMVSTSCGSRSSFWSPADMSVSTTMSAPGIRQVTVGHMTYVLPDKTVVYGPGEFFFELRGYQPHRLQQDGRAHGACALRDIASGHERAVVDSRFNATDRVRGTATARKCRSSAALKYLAIL